MKHETPNMADTQASNGQLTVKHKAEKDPASNLKNIGTHIYNPLTDKYIGKGHYSKLKREGIELSQLERNSWIDGFDGTLTVKEFLNQPHIQMLTNSKHNPLVEPATGEEYDAQKMVEIQADMKEALKVNHLSLIQTTVGQAQQIDELTRALNLECLVSQQLRHEFEKIRETSLTLSRMADNLVRSCDKVLGLDDQPF